MYGGTLRPCCFFWWLPVVNAKASQKHETSYIYIYIRPCKSLSLYIYICTQGDAPQLAHSALAHIAYVIQMDQCAAEADGQIPQKNRDDEVRVFNLSGDTDGGQPIQHGCLASPLTH